MSESGSSGYLACERCGAPVAGDGKPFCYRCHRDMRPTDAEFKLERKNAWRRAAEIARGMGRELRIRDRGLMAWSAASACEELAAIYELEADK